MSELILKNDKDLKRESKAIHLCKTMEDLEKLYKERYANRTTDQASYHILQQMLSFRASVLTQKSILTSERRTE